MIKDYQNKEILAAMKHQLNAAAKKSLMGEQGVANGSMPTGMADMDIRQKPKRNKGILN